MITPSWRAAPSGIVLKASGRDARRYLNSRLSNDLRSLQPGQSAQAAALTAQGRVEGLFTVFALPGDTFLLACEGGDRAEVLAAVRRFIVADRVTIEDISDLAAFVHVADSPERVMPLVAGIGEGGPLVAANPRISAAGSDCIILGADRAAVEPQLRERLGAPLGDGQYLLLRIQRGTPSFPEEVNGDLIVTESGLYDAVSFSKGCYVGQEVIERSDAIGKLPRALERIRLDGEVSVPSGERIMKGAGETIGKALSAAVDQQRKETFVFALLRSGTYGTGDSVTCAGVVGEILPHPVGR